jgi:CelD/BcsL family acetyltransferase involved in cellulose biosynthesis
MTALPEELRLATRVIRREAEWDAIGDHWNRLHAASAAASTPLDYRWLQRWWRVYRPSLRNPSLQVITVWRGARLVGALPLYSDLERSLPIRRLRFMSTGEAEFEETCADYLNVLSWPGEEQRCASLMWREIDRMSWDHLEFVNLADGAPLLQEAAGRRHVYRTTGTCPVADLTGGFDAYLQRLSSNARQRARRLLRESALAGARFEIAAPERCVEVFGDLIRLHQARWQRASEPGVFAAPRFVEFHRGIVEEWLPAGRAVLARLSLGVRPVAVLYGFVTGSRFDFYQSGVDTETGSLRSPGNLCHLLLMQALAARRIDAYDFLSGAASYKKRLATHENSLFSLQIWKPSLRAAAFRSVRLAGRALRAGFHRRHRSAPESYTG